LRTRSRSAGRLALLEQCLRALDRADHLRGLMATQELVVTTKSTGAQHMNPLVRAADEALATATRLARLLDLHWNASRDGELV
jgi:hypothetical protein